ncbi:MAG: large subunit ribosomal protein L31 [Gammaproteobacteria bacterium]
MHFGWETVKICALRKSRHDSGQMKQGIHPENREVVFQDISSEFSILTRSTVATRETITWEDGNEYPLLKLEISSQSHPFYTGKQHIMQTAKQVDKFRKRYGN